MDRLWIDYDGLLKCVEVCVEECSRFVDYWEKWIL